MHFRLLSSLLIYRSIFSGQSASIHSNCLSMRCVFLFHVPSLLCGHNNNKDSSLNNKRQEKVITIIITSIVVEKNLFLNCITPHAHIPSGVLGISNFLRLKYLFIALRLSIRVHIDIDYHQLLNSTVFVWCRIAIITVHFNNCNKWKNQMSDWSWSLIMDR